MNVMERWFLHRECDHRGVLFRADPENQTSAEDSAEASEELEEMQPEMDGCWFCHPELAPRRSRPRVDELLENERR